MTYDEKKSLYESIMEEVAKVLKKQINELSITTVRNAYDKKRKYSGFNKIVHHYDTDYSDYSPEFKYKIQKPIVPFFESITVSPMINLESSEENKDKKSNVSLDIIFNGTNGEFIQFQISKVDEYGDALEADVENLYTLDYEIKELFDETVLYADDIDLLRILSVRDAKAFVKMIRENTGITLSYRNFIVFPEELDYSDTNPWINYMKKHNMM